MESFIKNIEIRWSDLDPNFHVLHSRYYDFGAYCRMAFFVEQGLSPLTMKEHEIGPVLFREECIFKRELVFGDQVKVNLMLIKYTEDYSRWYMRHEIWKNENILAAQINIDGAWINTKLRKIAVPPPFLIPIFEAAPKSPEVEVIKK